MTKLQIVGILSKQRADYFVFFTAQIISGQRHVLRITGQTGCRRAPACGNYYLMLCTIKNAYLPWRDEKRKGINLFFCPKIRLESAEGYQIV
jgi:hypothetical protein